jgi:hypothetical protein
MKLMHFAFEKDMNIGGHEWNALSLKAHILETSSSVKKN